MASKGKQQGRDAVSSGPTRCQLFWAALFLVVASAGGWYLIVRFLL